MVGMKGMLTPDAGLAVPTAVAGCDAEMASGHKINTCKVNITTGGYCSIPHEL